MSDEEFKRPEWMTSISANVKTEDYLLGRKVDKTFELSQQEKADKAREARIELVAKDRIKFRHDPIVDLERRRHQLKMELISNPLKLKQFRERLLQMDRAKQSQEDIKPDLSQSEASSIKASELPHEHGETQRRPQERREDTRSRRPKSEHGSRSREEERERRVRDRGYHRKESSSNRHRDHHSSSKFRTHDEDRKSKHGHHLHHERRRSRDRSRERHQSRSPSSSSRSRRQNGDRHDYR